MSEGLAFSPADVLVLGTFHMANPGRDLINLKADDVLAPHRQAELAELVDLLAEFRPTKVCVERTPDRQDELDRSFAQFCADSLEPERDEIVQVGFRLARRCGLERVYAIDDDTAMDTGGLEAYFATHLSDAEHFERAIAAEQAAVEEKADELSRTPLRHFLRAMNDESEYRREASWYVDLAGLGGVGEHGGAEMLASWYRRNIRIFSNLAGITESGDRIFVLIGSGHVPILRDLIALSRRHRVVDVTSFL